MKQLNETELLRLNHLTPAQKKTWEAITDYMDLNGVSAQRALSDTGLSQSTWQKAKNYMDGKTLVKTTKGKPGPKPKVKRSYVRKAAQISAPMVIKTEPLPQSQSSGGTMMLIFCSIEQTRRLIMDWNNE